MEKEPSEKEVDFGDGGEPKVTKTNENPPSEPFIVIEMPINAVEPLFNALHLLRPQMMGKLEYRSVQLLKDSILLEIELYMETPEEKEERQTKFYQMFNEVREEKKRISQDVETYNV